MAENNIVQMCILRLNTASIFRGMSLNMARNCSWVLLPTF